MLDPLETRVLLSVTPQLIDSNAFGASAPSDFVQVGNVVFFTADDGSHGQELWSTDGTPEGTALVKDIHTITTDIIMVSIPMRRSQTT